MEDQDLRSIAQVRRLLENAAAAAPILASFTQERIDAILDALHAAALPKAADWARLAHEETGFGNIPDKTAKNLFASETVYRFIRPMKTVGVLSENRERRVIEIAAPAGIVAAIIPSTNPTSTAINKIFIALKSACPIVVSPHPNAKRCVAELARVLDEAARAAGAPEGAIACMTEVALEGTRELMRHPFTRVILATGGTGLVRAAYSSGKPAYGVGPGNVPAYVDRSAEIAKAARDIVNGKSFDNGVLCSAENAVVADAPISVSLQAAMKEAGCFFLDEPQAESLARLVVTAAGALNTKIVGKDARTIASMAGIPVPETTRCLVAKLGRVGPDEPLSREKLSPILAYYEEDGWERACARCLEILAYGGMGHTMSLHASDRDLIMRFALTKPVFRIVVNSPSAVGAVGLTTGVDPSMTLGCGALGGNITSDNITPRHLVNVKRLAFEITPYVPGGDAAVAAGRAKETPPPAGLAISTPHHATLPAQSTMPAPEAAPAPIVTTTAGTAPAESATPARAGRSTELRGRVEAMLLSRGILPGQSQPERSESQRVRAPLQTTSARPSQEQAGPAVETTAVPFVCEADVRQALSEKRKITISRKTIVTPAARDLGIASRVFVEI